jgi:hypothetical protein
MTHSGLRYCLECIYIYSNSSSAILPLLYDWKLKDTLSRAEVAPHGRTTSYYSNPSATLVLKYIY